MLELGHIKYLSSESGFYTALFVALFSFIKTTMKTINDLAMANGDNKEATATFQAAHDPVIRRQNDRQSQSRHKVNERNPPGRQCFLIDAAVKSIAHLRIAAAN